MAEVEQTQLNGVTAPAKRTRKRKVEVAPPQTPKRRRNRQPVADKEIRAEMKRLGMAVNSDNIEMFKLATYQVVQAKLAEVARLLRLVAPQSQQTISIPTIFPATPQARQPLTLENIDRMAGPPTDAQPAGPVKNPCQWCGRAGIAKNSRGMWVCQGHLPLAVEDDQKGLLRQSLARGFGANEEVIRVDAGTIQRAMANPSGEE